MLKGEPQLDFKTLEQGRGFLIHLAGTYPFIKPRMKDIHLTLDSWREGRDEEGWKINDRALSSLMEEGRRKGDTTLLEYKVNLKEHQGKVVAVKRLRHDLLALGNFFKRIEPPLRLVRGKRILLAKYGFGDASGSGFGSSWINPSGSISYWYGSWGSDMQVQSSNFRELCNLVETLETMGNDHELEGTEMFIFTDNAVAEAAFFKGNTSSPTLYELILRLNILELDRHLKLHIIHVAGTRMIAQGSDGLSRGNMMEGVMLGNNMLSFIPLHKSAIELQPNIETWIKSWVPETPTIEILSPEGWFERGHDILGYEKNIDGLFIPTIRKGTFIWSPPPAAADVAVQELRKARHKRQDSLHVFVCPRLMKPMWFKQLFKASDLLFEIKAGHSHWPAKHHEPLIIAVCFPYLLHRPWLLKNTPAIRGMDRILRGVWEVDEESGVSALREFCVFARILETMSSGLVWQMLHRGFQAELSCFTSRK